MNVCVWGHFSFWCRRPDGDAAKAAGTATAADAAGAAGAGAAGSQSSTPAGADLTAKVAELTAEVEEMKADRLRLLADMENVRAIARRDVDVAKAYAVQSFSKQLLDVVDTLGLALGSVPDDLLRLGSKELQTLHEGVSMTRTNLVKALATQGIKEVRGSGNVKSGTGAGGRGRVERARWCLWGWLGRRLEDGVARGGNP